MSAAAATVAPMKRKSTQFTALNLATLGLIVAYFAYAWWAIDYLISH